MLSRRQLIVAGAAALAARAARAEAPILTDDGLYRQPWFVESLLELADDIETARTAGRRFAVIWELRGCPYCKEMHFVNFARPDIASYVRENFDVLQLNIIGARKVTDVDGEELAEKALAAKYGVRGTPNLMFFPESPAGLAAKPPAERLVARARGYLEPQPFLALFRYVREKHYEKGSFEDYLGRTRS
jgi:thioredoxin-related protein